MEDIFSLRLQCFLNGFAQCGDYPLALLGRKESKQRTFFSYVFDKGPSDHRFIAVEMLGKKSL